VFLSTRLINIPHYIEPHYNAVLQGRLHRQVKRVAFSCLEANAAQRTAQRRGLAKMERARAIFLLRQALAALREHISWRIWRRQRAVSLYVKQAFSLLTTSLNAWIQIKRISQLHRRRMLGLRWAIANSMVGRIMAEWNMLASRGRSLIRLFFRAESKYHRNLLHTFLITFAGTVKAQRLRVRSYISFSWRRALSLVSSAFDGWGRKARLPRQLLLLQDRANGRYLSRLCGHALPFIAWCIASYLQHWHELVMRLRSNAQQEIACANRIHTRRLKRCMHEWSAVAHIHVEHAHRHMLIEQRAHARRALALLTLTFRWWEHHTKTRHARRVVYMAQTRAAERTALVGGLLGFKTHVEKLQRKRGHEARAEAQFRKVRAGAVVLAWCSRVQVCS